jgi:hypothetical protein
MNKPVVKQWSKNGQITQKQQAKIGQTSMALDPTYMTLLE